MPFRVLPLSDIPSHELKYAPRSVFHAAVRAGRCDARCCYISTKGVAGARIASFVAHAVAVRSRRKQCSRYVKECGISSGDAGVPEEKGDIRPSWNDPSEISIACIPTGFHDLLLDFSKKAGITGIDTITVERSSLRDFESRVLKNSIQFLGMLRRTLSIMIQNFG